MARELEPSLGKIRALRKEHAAFDHVSEFANVSGPVVALERLPRVLGDVSYAFPCDGIELVDNQRDEFVKIADTVGERGQHQFENGESVVEVGAKLSRGNALSQVAVAGSDNLNVDTHLLVGAERANALIFNDLEKLRLEVDMHLGQLVQK